MTVLCGACNAENRDAAKFCKGCGRKIAQAWPQVAAVVADVSDAALLLATANQREAVRKTRAAEEELRPTPAPPRARISNGRWIAALGLGVVLLVVAAAWWGQRNKSQEISAPATPALDAATSPPAALEPPAPVPAVTPEPVLSAPAGATVNSEPTPVLEAAAPANSKQRKPAAKKQPTPTAPPVVEAAVPAPPPPAPEPVRVPTPQESCAGRNFIARAQCLATQCARPELASHPQCEAVRQQQRLEEEKRNPTMAG